MDKKIFRRDVLCPSVEDFSKAYPQYAPFALADGNFLFQLINTPVSFVKMSVVSNLGLSAVYGIAEECSKLAKQEDKPLSNFTKQYIGAVICFLMESNGYSKSGKKKSVNHPEFSKGEIYFKA